MTLPHVRRVARAAVPLALLALGAACTTSTPVQTSASTTGGPAVSAGRTDKTTPATTAARDEPTTTVDDPDTSVTSAVEPPDACDLITEDDASKAFGEPATAGEQRRDECWWSSPNDLKTINIIRRTGDIEDWRRGYQNDQWEKNDYGDEGYSGRMLDSIVFRMGETTYEINVIYSTRGDPEQVVQDLAQIVVSRL